MYILVNCPIVFILSYSIKKVPLDIIESTYINFVKLNNFSRDFLNSRVTLIFKSIFFGFRNLAELLESLKGHQSLYCVYQSKIPFDFRVRPQTSSLFAIKFYK